MTSITIRAQSGWDCGLCPELLPENTVALSMAASRKKAKSGQPRKDPSGGLTAAGRRYFAEKEGAHLKPGVKGAADTPDKMRRKGSFLRRHYAHLRGPLQTEKGEPTRLALAAHAWGEPVPKTKAAAAKLAAKGAKLLERYARARTSRRKVAKRAKKTTRK